MRICELRGVGRRYPLGETEVLALQGVDLDIDAGAFLAFAGPSGSGKTTLLNLIGCLDRPSEGHIVLDGQDLGGLGEAELGRVRAEKVGFVFQSFNLIPVLTAVENVEVALRLGGQPKDRARCAAALAEVGLADLLDRRPAQLSGGQQQRVAIARALVKRPRLVIADEPTANLDSHTGAAVLDLMKDLNQRHGTTFLFSTHDPMVLERAGRVVRLRDGRVEAGP
ncbi:MAG: ABC transporter ATP-binding protein [Alphaproteobacteria bacterium]|nr:ABC transporter ATP-binding protein [Alphaproteobacteria bacterium]